LWGGTGLARAAGGSQFLGVRPASRASRQLSGRAARVMSTFGGSELDKSAMATPPPQQQQQQQQPVPPTARDGVLSPVLSLQIPASAAEAAPAASATSETLSVKDKDGGESAAPRRRLSAFSSAWSLYTDDPNVAAGEPIETSASEEYRTRFPLHALVLWGIEPGLEDAGV
jgi:hypothetical protein